MKEHITMDTVVTKLHETICNMKDAIILEHATLEGSFCHFVVFRNPKGCWVVYTNQNYIFTDGWCSLRMYHMHAPIALATAFSDTVSFNHAYCELCEKSNNLIANYSSGFTPDELCDLINFA